MGVDSALTTPKRNAVMLFPGLLSPFILPVHCKRPYKGVHASSGRVAAARPPSPHLAHALQPPCAGARVSGERWLRASARLLPPALAQLHACHVTERAACLLASAPWVCLPAPAGPAQSSSAMRGAQARAWSGAGRRAASHNLHCWCKETIHVQVSLIFSNNIRGNDYDPFHPAFQDSDAACGDRGHEIASGHNTHVCLQCFSKGHTRHTRHINR